MDQVSDSLKVEPAGPLRGRLRVPGDKSISHRALILGALAEDDTRIEGFLRAGDTLATLECLRALGVAIEASDGQVVVHGRGPDGLSEPETELDCGNAGTAMRLLAGVLAGQPFTATLTGDESLRRRPMDRIIRPLSEMGAVIRCAEEDRAPLTITGRRPLAPIQHVSPVASAQVKSCVLLAGLFVDGRTEVTEPSPSRDHTERMLAAFGCPVERLGSRVAVTGGTRLRGASLSVPGDPSSAAFFAVAATLVPGSDVVLEGVGINPTRDGFIHVLRQMGADIELENERETGGETLADLRVRHAALRGAEIDPYYAPSAIDELPVLFVAAATAVGETVFRAVEELRFKESDRIAVMAQALRALGIDVEEFHDGLAVRGGTPRAAEVDATGDHRCAMALAVAALVADGPVRISGAGGIATSYPGFLDDLRSLMR